MSKSTFLKNFRTLVDVDYARHMFDQMDDIEISIFLAEYLDAMPAILALNHDRISDIWKAHIRNFTLIASCGIVNPMMATVLFIAYHKPQQLDDFYLDEKYNLIPLSKSIVKTAKNTQKTNRNKR